MAPVLSSAVSLMTLIFITCKVSGDWTAEMPMTETVGQGEAGQTAAGQHHYCNTPKDLTGSEGTVVPGFILHQVHLVLTPGETAAPGSQLHLNLPSVSCQPGSSTSSEKLKSLKETLNIYKTVQPDRQGFKHLFPKFSPTCTDNELTATGYSQLVSLGEHTHRSYSSQHHVRLLSTDINVEIIPSTSAYASMLSFLHGLLPEKLFAKTVVRKTLDNVCHPEKSNVPSCHCGKVEELRPFVYQAIRRGRFMFKDSIPQKEELNNLFNGQVTHASALELLESIMPSYCSRNSTVCFDGTSCLHLSQHSISSLYNMVSTFLQRVFSDPTFKQFMNLHTYPFLHRVFSPRNSHNKFFNVYMVEKHFLQLLQTGLGIHEEVMPLASRLIIEVLKSEDPSKRSLLYVRVVYNGRDVTGEVTHCDHQLEKGLCPLSSLQQWVTRLQDMYEHQC